MFTQHRTRATAEIDKHGVAMNHYTYSETDHVKRKTCLFIVLFLFTISLNCTPHIWRVGYATALFAIVINRCNFFSSLTQPHSKCVCMFFFRTLAAFSWYGSCLIVDVLWFLMSFMKSFSTVNVHMLYCSSVFSVSLNCIIMTGKRGNSLEIVSLFPRWIFDPFVGQPKNTQHQIIVIIR